MVLSKCCKGVSLVHIRNKFINSLTMASNSKDLELVIITFEDPELMEVRTVENLDLHIIHT